MTDNKTQIKICKFHNTGYCKQKGSCKFLHPTERCEKSCKQKTCLKRHPKPCRYGQKCRRMETCDYKHNPSSTEKDLKAEIEALKISIKHLLEESKGTKTQIANLENELMGFKEGARVKKFHPESKEINVSSEMGEAALSGKSMEAKKSPTKLNKKVLLSCTDCFRQFSDQSHLKKHQKNCEVKKLFKCKTCKLDVKQDNDIFLHKVNCEDYCTNCEICVAGDDQTRHILEEVDLPGDQSCQDPCT